LANKIARDKNLTTTMSYLRHAEAMDHERQVIANAQALIAEGGYAPVPTSLAAQQAMNAERFERLYALKASIIEHDIVPRFSADDIARARALSRPCRPLERLRDRVVRHRGSNCSRLAFSILGPAYFDGQHLG
jgi:hypothetical protein